MVENIVEMYIDRLVLFRGTKEEYRKEITEMCRKARDFGIQANIKFFNRKHHNKRLKEKAELDNSYKAYYGDLDDLVAENAKYWKKIEAYYNYFQKDVPRR